MEALANPGDRVRLGISPLSWTNDVLADLGDEIPLEECLKDASEIGYEGVELGRKFPKDPKGIATRSFRSSGLSWPPDGIRDTSRSGRWKSEWEAAADHIRIVEGLRHENPRLWRVWQNAR